MNCRTRSCFDARRPTLWSVTLPLSDENGCSTKPIGDPSRLMISPDLLPTLDLMPSIENVCVKRSYQS